MKKLWNSLFLCGVVFSFISMNEETQAQDFLPKNMLVSETEPPADPQIEPQIEPATEPPAEPQTVKPSADNGNYQGYIKQIVKIKQEASNEPPYPEEDNFSTLSNALVCYYNLVLEKTQVDKKTPAKKTTIKYDVLKRTFGKKKSSRNTDDTYYLNVLGRYENQVVFTNETDSDLRKICENTMLKEERISKEQNDISHKVEFKFFKESTRYYPFYPVPSIDYDRPIFTTGHPFSTKFQNLVIFGDSLSDQGNIKRKTSLLKPIAGVEIPGEPYWGGRFTNNYNWVDYLSDKTGMFPFNWAYGSAESSNDVVFNVPLSLKKQIDDFITNQGSTYVGLSEFVYGGYGNFDQTLYGIAIGSNNYINIIDVAEKKEGDANIK